MELINKEETALFHTVSKMDKGGVPGLLFDFLTHNILSLLSRERENKYSIELVTFQRLPSASVTHIQITVGISCVKCRVSKLCLESRIWAPPAALVVIVTLSGILCSSVL